MSNWLDIGSIVKLQIHRDRLRTGNNYHLDPLVEVSKLRLTSDGPIGFNGSSWIIDCHHRSHPSVSRYQPERALSIGFTSHYEHIWRMFEPIPLGAGGENLIVGTDRVLEPKDLVRGIRIESADGRTSIPTAAVAEPCVPFTRLVTGRPDAGAAELVEQRERLRGGIRGFIMALEGIDFFDLSPGDRVAINSG